MRISTVFVLGSLVLAAACAPVEQQRATTAPAGPRPLENADPALRACDEGDLDECFTASQHLKRDVDAETRARIAARYSVGCQRDGAEDCFRAALFVSGFLQQIELTRRSCELGLVEGCYMLAVQLEMGEDMAKRPELGESAAKLYEATCERDFAAGCSSLAHRLERAGDLERALELHERSCELDEDVSCSEAQRLACQLGRRQDCPAPGEGLGGVVGGEMGGVVGGEIGGEIAPPPPAKP